MNDTDLAAAIRTAVANLSALLVQARIQGFRVRIEDASSLPSEFLESAALANGITVTRITKTQIL